MANYLEIKQVLKEILDIKDEVDEECDMIWTPSIYNEDVELIFHNNDLKQAFDNIEQYNKNKLVISTDCYREVAIQTSGLIGRNGIDLEPLKDNINGILYSVGPASLEYCMFILDSIAENANSVGRRVYSELRRRCRMTIRRIINHNDIENPLNLLPEILRIDTLTIRSETKIRLNQLKEYATSYEFLIMYKRNVSISEYTDMENLYSIGMPFFSFCREEIDLPPRRIYNAEILDYYAMAMESRDPFTMYISFYHVIEHYFDTVFRKKLTEEIKDRITKPDFSYKNEDKLYELAKYIRKHMRSDDISGKGNEFESLKYVLMEYVPIDDLEKRIIQLNPKAIEYYQENFVPFTSSKKTKICWSDVQGVYTNLTNRIYETRNALVHSKSEQANNQYKPYKNRNELSAEIALIRAISEAIIINSSRVL